MTITFRQGTEADHFGAFCIFRIALHRLSQSLELALPEDKPTADSLKPAFERFRPYTEHLTQSAEHIWVAEEDGEIVGFSRSVLRDGVRQLSELFVHPDKQTQGVGKRLLELAFPNNGADNRVIIASPDVRAVSRYLKTGVRFRFTIYEWYRKPEVVPFETDLSIEPLEVTPETLAELNAIDRVIIGYTHEVDHIWLSKIRHGHIYRRDGKAVGYSYLSNRAGPIAMLNNADFIAALAHVESEMTKYVDDVYNEFYVSVPLTNQAAMEYVLKRGCQTTAFLEHFLSDKPLGQYENYVFMDPPLIT
jgi:GNAT superfamily N-acetyltransferase